jgi:hypothetical protein
MSRRIWSIVVIGVLALGTVLWWFFGNFFYDLLWAFLEDHNISHAKVMAFTLAQLLPFVLAIILVGLIYLAIRYEFAQHVSPTRSPRIPIGDLSGPITARAERNYILAEEAVRFIANESEWGERIREARTRGGMRQIPLFAAIEELVRAARGGEIIIFGRFGGVGEHQLISQQYWLYATIDPQSVLTPNQVALTTSTHPDLRAGHRFTPYDALCVERSEVVRLWPRPRPIRSARWSRWMNG